MEAIPLKDIAIAVMGGSPHERRSARPGDATASLEARRRLHARSFEAPLMEAAGGLLSIAVGEAILDVGCGAGDHLGP